MLHPFPGYDKDVPFFLIGYDALALKTWTMKSYMTKKLIDYPGQGV